MSPSSGWAPTESRSRGGSAPGAGWTNGRRRSAVGRVVGETMARVDGLHGARLHAHHHGMRFGAVSIEPHAVEHVSVGHAGRGEDDRVPAREVGLAIDPVMIG